MEEWLGLCEPTLSFLNLLLESVGKQRGSQEMADSQATWQKSKNSAPGVRAGRRLLYWQVARCHSRRRIPWLNSYYGLHLLSN